MDVFYSLMEAIDPYYDNDATAWNTLKSISNVLATGAWEFERSRETKAVAGWDDWGICTSPLQITNQLSVSFAVIEQYIQGKRSL